jgi:hypothetical protein
MLSSITGLYPLVTYSTSLPLKAKFKIFPSTVKCFGVAKSSPIENCWLIYQITHQFPLFLLVYSALAALHACCTATTFTLRFLFAIILEPSDDKSGSMAYLAPLSWLTALFAKAQYPIAS